MKWLLGGALALLAIWTVFHLDTAGSGVAIAATGLVAAATLWPRLPGLLPRLFWAVAVPLLIVYFALDVAFGAFIDALIRLNILLILFRALSYRTRREDMQLVVLALFLVVVSGVLTVSLVFALQILLFAGVAMTFLFFVNLVDGAQPGAGGQAGPWVELDAGRLFLRLRRAGDLRLFGLAVVLFILLVLISSLIFLLIPRFQIDNQLGLLDIGGRRTLSGFSETVQFTDVTDIQQDDSLVLRVEVADRSVLPDVPYWRMVALDEYTSGGFRLSLGLQEWQVRRGTRNTGQLEHDAMGVGRVRRDRPGATDFTFYLEHGISRFLPLTGPFHSLSLPERHELIVNPYTQVVSTRFQQPKMLPYRVIGMEAGPRFAGDWERIGQRFGAVDGQAPEPGRPLVIAPSVLESTDGPAIPFPATLTHVPVPPADREFLAAAVAEITGGEALDALAFRDRAQAWLARRHSYSMRSRLPPGEGDRIVRWLRSASPGHCEYFAGAFTLLARTAGHPTRVVTGFRGGDWNAFEGYFMIRNSSAHAWVEIYDGAGFWHLAEPTPASDARPGETATGPTPGTAVDESFGAYLDSLRVVWYRRIINFDQQAQVQLADDIRTATRTAASSLRARLEQVALDLRNWAQRPFDRDKLRLALLLGALGLVLAWSIWRIRSTGIWIGWRLDQQGRLELVRRQASHLLRRWERRFGRPDESAPATERELHGALRRLRWGPPAPPVGARRVLGEARRHLRQAPARRPTADQA